MARLNGMVAVPLLIAGLLISAVALTPLTPAAWAEGADKGQINAVSFRDIPPGSSFQLESLDNSDLSVAVLGAVRDALIANGYQISESGNLLMTLEVEDQVGAYSHTNRRNIIQLEGENATGKNEKAKALLNLYDSDTGGLINKGHGGTRIVTPSRYRVDLMLDDTSNGKRVWHGWSTAELGSHEPVTLTKAMAPGLVAKIGQSIRQAPFDLP